MLRRNNYIFKLAFMATFKELYSCSCTNKAFPFTPKVWFCWLWSVSNSLMIHGGFENDIFQPTSSQGGLAKSNFKIFSFQHLINLLYFSNAWMTFNDGSCRRVKFFTLEFSQTWQYCPNQTKFYLIFFTVFTCNYVFCSCRKISIIGYKLKGT